MAAPPPGTETGREPGRRTSRAPSACAGAPRRDGAGPDADAPPAEIRIEGARSHNLANATVRIPLGSLTVVTGPSGSGKSSLAFDTLYAEGQRRYVASLSTYARQFLERLPRPEVDAISHLPPAIAIERRNRVTNARSTVGTATEILDHLRLLFTHAGAIRCPACGAPVEPGHLEAVASRLAARHRGGRVQIGAPLPPRRGEAAGLLRERLLADGYGRVLDATGRVHDLADLSARALDALRGDGLLLVDRLAISGGEGEHARLAEAVSNAYRMGGGAAVVVDAQGGRETVRQGLVCDACGRRFPALRPALFSFNSPLGACEACQGFGRVAVLDPERVVPDPSRSLRQGAVVPFTTPSGRKWQAKLLAAASARGVPTDVPWEQLGAGQRRFVFAGGDGYRGVDGFFRRLERKRYKVQARVLIARYRRYDPCEACAGTRLQPEARSVIVAGRSLPEVTALPLGELVAWLAGLSLPAAATARVERLLGDLRARVDTAVEAGLDYMTLDRPTRTLSDGEAQRIQLAAALGGTLTSSLYVLDEPSIGLHARDVERLVGILRRIRDQGNTLVVVEHALELIAAADHVIDLGPGAGRLGGTVVAQGPVARVRDCATSLTGQALSGTLPRAQRRRRGPRGRLRIVGARAHNLRDVDVDVPLGQLVVFTGVSGAGKSTLVRSVLVGHLRRDPERGACDRIEGAEQLREVVMVEPAALARSPRSNAATVSKAFEGIRRRFAATRQARARGLTPGWFSFNVAGGRCEACEGSGEVVIDMQFLDDVRMPCEACDGTRYRPEAREVRLEGRSIVEVLALTVDEALAHFAADAAITTRLSPLARVGLGYLTLGQPLSTLSGGEVQRLRIAQALREGAPRTLYVFDEPTTGLHAADVEVLLRCFDELLDAGASILVVEHHLDVIRRADHVIDLGPEGGPGGGRVVATGPPEAIAAAPDSITGAALRAATS